MGYWAYIEVGSWSDIVKPDSTINTAGEGMATGIVRIDGKLIIIL